MDSLRLLLDPRVLTASYSQRPNQRPYPLTDAFFVNPEPIEGDAYRLFFDPAENEPAPLNQPGAEARVLQAAGAEERFATLFQAFNKLPLQGQALNALREPDSETLQDMGKTEIRRQHDKFSARHRLMKETVIAKIITEGIVYLDEYGRVLESSSGAQITADFEVPAKRKNQLDQGSGNLIGASWAAAGTDIQAHLNAIDDAAEADNVEPPTDIWCHTLFKDNLRNNTDFQTWAAASAADSEQILRGNMIEGLFGKTWHFYGGKYLNTSGTMQNFIPTTKVVLTPPIGPWLKATEGSMLVPSSIGVQQSWEAALAQTQKVHGPFSYAKLIDDPVQLFLYMGDTFGLHFADPDAIWMPTVVF